MCNRQLEASASAEIKLNVITSLSPSKLPWTRCTFRTPPFDYSRLRRTHILAKKWNAETLMIIKGRTLFCRELHRWLGKDRVKDKSAVSDERRHEKVFVCRMTTFTRARQQTKNKDPKMEGWGTVDVRRWVKKKKEEGGSHRELHGPFCLLSHTSSNAAPGSFEAQKPLRGVERQLFFFNQIFIQCKAGEVPPTTFSHRSTSPLLHEIQNKQRHATPAAQARPRLLPHPNPAYSRCSSSSSGGRWATCSWTPSPRRWRISGGCTPFHQPACTPSPWENKEMYCA